jgi:molybdenum cofactor guanylyltransferase
MKSFAAVLLAGGQSSRMGLNKALLDYHGTPLWQFQMEKLVRLRPQRLLFSVQPNIHLPPGPWTFVHDRLPEAGPLGGLEAALRHTREGFLVVLAVDMPAMTTEFLGALSREAGPFGLVPRLAGLYHGTAAVYPVEILPLVETILAGDDRSFQRLIRDALHCGLMRVREIPPSSAGLFENWNLPEDSKVPRSTREREQSPANGFDDQTVPSTTQLNGDSDVTLSSKSELAEG